MNNTDAYPGWRNSGAKNIVGAEVSSFFTGVLNVGNGYSINTKGSNDIVYLPTGSYSMTQSQWIASYPDLIVQLLLPYAEPIIIDLPDGDPIITFNGINNIYADSGDASVEYLYHPFQDNQDYVCTTGNGIAFADNNWNIYS